MWLGRTSATKSTSLVERSSPWIELAREPPTRYGMPSRSRIAATSSASAMGPGGWAGAMLRRPPAVRFRPHVLSQASHGESQQQLAVAGRRVLLPEAGQCQGVHRTGDGSYAGGLLRRGHPPVQLELFSPGLRGGVGWRKWSGHEVEYGVDG